MHVLVLSSVLMWHFNWFLFYHVSFPQYNVIFICVVVIYINLSSIYINPIFPSKFISNFLDCMLWYLHIINRVRHIAYMPSNPLQKVIRMIQIWHWYFTRESKVSFFVGSILQPLVKFSS